MALAEATVEELRRDVDLALDANLDLLRVHAHVTRPEFYDAADERGLLLWQDFPLQWGYARGVRKQAVRQARRMVDLLGNHPSIVVWCAHNEPLAVDMQPGEPLRAGAVAKIGASMFLPSWNKDVLDRSVARQIGRCDPTRAVVRHSGVFPNATSLGTDTHTYFGWYYGDMADLAPALRRFPRLARFVTEFGAQAVPTTNEWMHPDRFPDLDWDDLFERHALQRRIFDRYVPVADCKTFDEWCGATQAYQAALVQLQVEDLRRLKYSPTGGFAQFCFADGHSACPSAVTTRCATRAGRYSRWSNRATGSCTS
jgi:beta-mannosidase